MPALASYDEKQLLMQMAMGDEQAFTRIFYMHHQKLGAFILKVSKSRELAQEIVQDVFLKIWANRSTINEIQCFEAYLFAVARNHAYTALKKQAIEYLKKLEYIRVTSSRDNASQDTATWKDQHLQLIEEAVSRLPHQQQKIYLLSRKKGMKYDEIAAHLGLSFETVKKHMHLALRFIRNYINLHKEPVLLLLSLFFF